MKHNIYTKNGDIERQQNLELNEIAKQSVPTTPYWPDTTDKYIIDKDGNRINFPGNGPDGDSEFIDNGGHFISWQPDTLKEVPFGFWNGPGYDHQKYLEKVQIDKEEGDLDRWLYKTPNLKEFEIDSYAAETATNLKGMFAYCGIPGKVDLGKYNWAALSTDYDPSPVEYLFYGAQNVEEIIMPQHKNSEGKCMNYYNGVIGNNPKLKRAVFGLFDSDDTSAFECVLCPVLEEIVFHPDQAKQGGTNWDEVRLEGCYNLSGETIDNMIKLSVGIHYLYISPELYDKLGADWWEEHYLNYYKSKGEEVELNIGIGHLNSGINKDWYSGDWNNPWRIEMHDAYYDDYITLTNY